ncbi:hypothetical protein G6F22_017518 [Rhizopus arrhizus]|nr:hypothetical protein G6F22_017518 [Rhizopus arrhizus]KAG1386320.1 hypothetical protein G6F60_014516 [Rhizopus arrhizus]
MQRRAGGGGVCGPGFCPDHAVRHPPRGAPGHARRVRRDLAQQDHPPHRADHQQRGGLGSAAHVLGVLGQRVVVKRDAVDHCFDGRVEQLHQQADEADGQHHGPFDRADVQHERRDHQQRVQQQQLPEGRFAPEGGDEAVA